MRRANHHLLLQIIYTGKMRMNIKDVLKKFLEFFMIQFIAYPLGGVLSVNLVGKEASMRSTWIVSSVSFAILMTLYFTARQYNYRMATAFIFTGLFAAFLLIGSVYLFYSPC